MCKLLLLFFPLLLIGCSNKSNEPIQFSNEIDVSIGIRNAKEKIYFSELIDSITFIPLETKSNNLFGRISYVKLTTDYIYHHNNCFGWDGKFVAKIGRRGQGPCEDHGEYISLEAYINEHFYTKGAKFIEYDKSGNCTGKERSLYQLDRERGIGSFINLGGIEKTGRNIIAFNHPDSVFFFNTDFEVVNKYPTSMEWGRPEYAQNLSETNLTYYNDTVVFYHYYTDTVYHATENTLIPKWIIKIDESDKLSTDYVYKNGELMNESFAFFQQGRQEDARLCKDMDNKIYAWALYETDTYLFLLCNKTRFFRELRNLPKEPSFLVFYDKTTGKTTASNKIIDDICGIDDFFPDCGICNNKMVMSIWPYQLEEMIQKKQKTGVKINERLLQLMQQVDIEDNPILIVAHLKK